MIESGRRHEAEELSLSMDQKNLGVALAELLHGEFGSDAIELQPHNDAEFLSFA